MIIRLPVLKFLKLKRLQIISGNWNKAEIK